LTRYGTDATYKAGIDAAVKNVVTGRIDQGIAGANSTLGKGNTKVKVDTQNISMIFGFQPIANLNFYGGGVYQQSPQLQFFHSPKIAERIYHSSGSISRATAR